MANDAPATRVESAGFDDLIPIARPSSVQPLEQARVTIRIHSVRHAAEGPFRSEPCLLSG